MNKPLTLFHGAMIFIACLFTLVFCAVVVPPLIAQPDIVGAFAAGFVNPYATGYSIDVILCGLTLGLWVIYEAKVYGVRYGWLCLILACVPGVAVGFPLYLILRHRYIQQNSRASTQQPIT